MFVFKELLVDKLTFLKKKKIRSNKRVRILRSAAHCRAVPTNFILPASYSSKAHLLPLAESFKPRLEAAAGPQCSSVTPQLSVAGAAWKNSRNAAEATGCSLGGSGDWLLWLGGRATSKHKGSSSKPESCGRLRRQNALCSWKSTLSHLRLGGGGKATQEAGLLGRSSWSRRWNDRAPAGAGNLLRHRSSKHRALCR